MAHEVKPEKEMSSPVYQAEALLRQALAEIGAPSRSDDPNLTEVLGIISGAAERLPQMGGMDLSEPESRSAMNKVMEELRDALGTLQTLAKRDFGMEHPARLTAKSLAILYPLTKIGTSKVPASPVPSKPVPPMIEERRKARRISIEAEIGFQSDTNFFMGFSEDISTGGLFIATYDTRPMGSLINVNFTLPSGHLISTDGVVRWIREYNETTPDTPPGMGIQFENLSPQDKEAIEMFVNQRPALFYDDE
jgi:uncharacterized protein (TIGR02266 family)